jgi:hypothetical protein
MATRLAYAAVEDVALNSRSACAWRDELIILPRL